MSEFAVAEFPEERIRRFDNRRIGEAPGGAWPWGNQTPLGDEESIGGDAQDCVVVVESTPPSAVVVAEAEFLLEIREIALDAPLQLGGVPTNGPMWRATYRRAASTAGT
jgi:hypothetical protein